jgi:uroporphyrinogen-III synthase
MSALLGKRILITRPREQADEFVRKLQASGGEPVSFPTIAIEPLENTGELDRAAADLSSYDWVIFTSVNGVLSFWDRLSAAGKDQRAFQGVQVAAIGPSTAQALIDRGVQPDFVPDEFIAEAIVTGLGIVSQKRILLPRADIARAALFNELQRLGAFPDEIPAYRTIPAHLTSQELAQLDEGIDVITFTSSSTVRNFLHILQQYQKSIPENAIVACIGPITASTARECGLHVDIVADEYTTDGLAEALVAYFESRL